MTLEAAMPSDDGPLTARQERNMFHSADPTVTGPASGEPSPALQTPSMSPAKTQRVRRSHYRRMSLPSLNQLLMQEQEKRQMQADEEHERLDYEHKARYATIFPYHDT